MEIAPCITTNRNTTIVVVRVQATLLYCTPAPNIHTQYCHRVRQLSRHFFVPSAALRASFCLLASRLAFRRTRRSWRRLSSGDAQQGA